MTSICDSLINLPTLFQERMWRLILQRSCAVQWRRNLRAKSSAPSTVRHRMSSTLLASHTANLGFAAFQVIPKTIIKMVQTASLHGTQSVRVGVWQCSLWGHALKRSPGINRKSRVLYPGPGFLSSATWPLLPKKHYNGLIINHIHTRPFSHSLAGAKLRTVYSHGWQKENCSEI